MSLHAWIECVTSIIMQDQNVSLATKQELGAKAQVVLEELENHPTPRPAGCECFVSIESYNACPVHGTANQTEKT